MKILKKINLKILKKIKMINKKMKIINKIKLKKEQLEN